MVRIVVFSIVGMLAACGFFGEGRLDGEDIGITWELLANEADEGSFRSALTISNQGDAVLPAGGWELYYNGPAPDVTPDALSVETLNGNLVRMKPTDSFEPLSPGESRRFEFASEVRVANRSLAPAGFYLVMEDGERALPLEDVAILFPDPDAAVYGGVPIPTPQSRYRENAELEKLPPREVPLLIPRPRETLRGTGKVDLTASFVIRYQEGLESEADYLAQALQELLGRRPAIEQGDNPGREIVLLRGGSGQQQGNPEGYRLSIAPAEGIRIEGNSPAGVFYGIQSLRAVIPPSVYADPAEVITLPQLVIQDDPRFPYRGMHLDVARNFQPIPSVELLLDLMSFYKLNRFHFHLSDDEGWRLEIPHLPELTEIGARRGQTRTESDRLIPAYGSGPFDAGPPGSGFYTRQEFVELLNFAKRRHIQVIPEIDLPGHSRAAIRAMEARAQRLSQQGDEEAAARYRLIHPEDQSDYVSVQGWRGNVVDVCQESTYRFVETVIDAVIELFEEAEAPLTAIHIGGDEVPGGVWEGSPGCEALMNQNPDLQNAEDLFDYFIERVSSMLQQRGLITAGWEEIGLIEGSFEAGQKQVNPRFANSNFQVYVWNSIWGWGGEENAYRLANAGYPVVMSNASNLYFDLAYNRDPEEVGLTWAGYVDTRKPFEFSPLNLYHSATTDRQGNTIPPETYAESERLTREGRPNILGIQGQLWSETLTEPSRLEYMAFPKLLGLAERAWSRAPNWSSMSGPERQRHLVRDWNVFANALGQRELPRLDHMKDGVKYRIPLPGAIIDAGQLNANVAFPGLAIRYTVDGSEPTQESPLYEGPVAVSETVRLRTFATNGRSSRTSVIRR